MRNSTTWFDHLRSRITGQPARVYATRRAARADLHALEARRAEAAARLNEDIELIDRYVNPLERYMDGGRLITPLGTILDRRSGKNLPLVWTELDLREFRRWSRVICDINPFAVGFLGLLTDFHIRQGFGWQVVERGTKEAKTSEGFRSLHSEFHVPRSAIEICQIVLDEWRDHQQWAIKSREAFKRWRRDGEVFLRFFRGGAETRGLPVIRFVEPEQVGPPPGDDADGRWSFGILTDPEDVESVYAYFVRDPLGTGSEGDEVAAGRILHLKANVDTSIKRGLPDFLPVQDDLERVRRMLRNMGEVAAIQTAIAWVSQYATATVDQVGTLIRAGSDYTRPKIGDPSGKLIDVVNYEPGTVIHMDSNRQFLAGPVGTGTAGFIQVEQAILRGCGTRWRFPEYFSGDASNNNMASSIVSGSPFVVAVEGNQLEWGVFERAVAKKVLELCVESGLLSREQIACVDVKVTPPAVALANREEEERLRQMRHQAGVLSVTTWQQQVGLDPKHEARNFEAEAKRKAAEQKSGDSESLETLDPIDGLEGVALLVSEAGNLVKAQRMGARGLQVRMIKPDTMGTNGWEPYQEPKEADGSEKAEPGKDLNKPTAAASATSTGDKKSVGGAEPKGKSGDGKGVEPPDPEDSRKVSGSEKGDKKKEAERARIDAHFKNAPTPSTPEKAVEYLGHISAEEWAKVSNGGAAAERLTEHLASAIFGQNSEREHQHLSDVEVFPATLKDGQRANIAINAKLTTLRSDKQIRVNKGKLYWTDQRREAAKKGLLLASLAVHPGYPGRPGGLFLRIPAGDMYLTNPTSDDPSNYITLARFNEIAEFVKDPKAVGQAMKNAQKALEDFDMKDWDEMTQKEQEDAQRKNGRDATLPEVHAFVDGVARDSKKFESLAEKMAAADVEATAKAAAAADVEATAKAAAAADVEATAKAAAAADVEATAKAAAAANPDVFLAQAAKMLGITIEELKRKQ